MDQAKNETEFPRCALILAGGRSRRMGMDKASLPFEGQTLLQRAVDFWSRQRMDRIYVSLGGDTSPLLPQGVIPLWDKLPHRGPLGGLYTAFTTTEEPCFWVSGVDMPFLSGDAVLPVPIGDAGCYRSGGRPQPLFAVYRRSVLPTAEALLNEGNYRLTELLHRVDTQWVDASDDQARLFLNWNAPEEVLRSLAGTPPMISVAAWSGTGKTTFLETLLPVLKRRGYSVAVIKHTHHTPSADSFGKDSARLQAAGAKRTVVLTGDEDELRRISSHWDDCDLILAEGYKFSSLPKLVLHRKDCSELRAEETTVIAHITDKPVKTSRPQLSWQDTEGCADLLEALLIEK